MPIVVLMGVAGSGKSTVGRAVARRLQWDFHDADDYHSPANIAKIAANQPLTDSDRAPWLATLHQLLQGYATTRASSILACSALKHRYRQTLLSGCPSARLVYLKGTHPLIRDRLQQRRHHFATAALLDSQFATLEEPTADGEGAFIVSIARPLAEIVTDIVQYLQKSPAR